MDLLLGVLSVVLGSIKPITHEDALKIKALVALKLFKVKIEAAHITLLA